MSDDGSIEPRELIDAADANESFPLPYRVGNAIPEALIDFVEVTIRELLTVDHRSLVWCHKWPEHPAAVHRLFALFVKWTDPERDLDAFLRISLPAHIDAMCNDETGIFKRCREQHRLNVILGGT